MEDQQSKEVQAVYKQLIEAWNNQNARGMADLFAENGESIGFDGSQSIGREEIFSHLDPIFEHHQTAQFVSKVKNVHLLSSNVVMIRAIAGMIPPQSSDLNPNVNTHHTLILVKKAGKWYIQLFQNTPAQFHGRPELVERMTEELRQLLT
ncbi:methionyl-tRNA formyltransferase [Mesobacillus campisalis]|uniref:Methionyl-tRNA formyltransferase n=1 Tax=Mesobacillus campisalis TaxID=1408103 RepID=A0A0M2T2W5_9BACI|nr:SgcJ/EcaC family oxidoreductase [Mesobacillus campisalis]KKK39155.1 methionyl-tRNA formyltransferase [Mesobacillus campisalis]